MKNKTTKILLIISMVIILIGVVGWFGVNSLIDESDNVTLLFSLMGSVALRLLIVVLAFGLIALMWLVYGIVILFKKNKSNGTKFANPSSIIIFLILIMLILSPLFSLFTTKNEEYVKNKYDYNIKYQDNAMTYNIYKMDNRVVVYSEDQVQCIKAPCPAIKGNYEIKFSDSHMKIVNDFIDSFFEDSKYNSIQVYSDNLNDEQNNILKSIIYNDEKELSNVVS